MDYGGVQIFCCIRQSIFPEWKPFHMDVETFEQYRSEAVNLEDTARQKLEKLDKLKAAQLAPLMEHILQTGLVIEQESFLSTNKFYSDS